MNFAALVLLLVLTGTACSSPVCPAHCKDTDIYAEPRFQHVSDLQHTSIAPWNLTENYEQGREPYAITHAVCKDCNVTGMIARPIYLRIYVYQRRRNHVAGNGDVWCRCPYNLAVGCTCVTK